MKLHSVQRMVSMPFNLQELRSQLTFGGAKPTLFQVQITNPVNNAGDLKTPFMVKAAQIPESELGQIEVPYFGRKIKIAGDRVFAPWTVTVINDEDFLIRNSLENWMHSINSHSTNITSFGTSSPLSYKSQAQVIQYSKVGAVLREYNFDGIFPVAITPIDMSWEAVDSIEEYQVTFVYDWWTVSGGITGNAGTE